MIGNGHAAGVTAQVAENLARATESRLGINDPVLSVQTAQKFAELFFTSQTGRRPGAP
jgi:hypothetical protein